MYWSGLFDSKGEKMSTGISWPTIGGDPYEIPASGEVNWAELSEYLIALANAQSTTAQKFAARVATTSPVTIGSASDYLVTVKMAVPGAVTINLPAGVVGQGFALGDGTGDAATNNITIVPNGTDKIAGLSSYILNQDGASVQLVFTGAGNWTITAQAAGEGGGGGVARTAIDAGTPTYVVYNNDTTGLLAEEQYLAAKRGGLGINASASTGVVKFTAGVASVSAISNADLGAGIDAAKIGGGNVSNAEYNFLDGVTSNIQTQLDAKAPAGSYITSLTGDVAATGPGAAASTIQPGAITNAKVNAAAAIDYAKLAALTINKAVVSSGTGVITTATTSTTELNYLVGVSSLVQTQLDAKIAGPAASVDSEIMLYSGTTGKLAKRSTLSGVVKLTTGVVSTSAVDLATAEVTGTLPIARGGTGQVTAQTALDGLLPVQTGNNGKVLGTNGSTATWVVSSGSGSGSGEKNYALQGTNSATGWTTSGAGIAVTTESTASLLPDNATQTTGIKILRASGTDYAYLLNSGSNRLQIDNANLGTLLKIQFDMKYAGAAGDYSVRLFAYSAATGGTGTEIPVVNGSLPGSNFSNQIQATFSPTATLPFIEARVYGNAGTTALYLNNFLVGPGTVGTSPAIGPGVAWTPTGSWTTNTTYTGRKWQVGPRTFYYAKLTLAGAPNNTTLSVNMPTGETIDSSVDVTQYANPFGRVSVLGAGGPFNAQVVSSGVNSSVQVIYQNNVSGAQGNFGPTSPFTFATGNTIELWWDVPVAENAGASNLNVGPGAQAEYASNSDSSTSQSNTTTGFVYGGSIFPTRAPTTAAADTIRRVQFSRPIQAGDRVILETQTGSTGPWIPVANGVGVDSYNAQNTAAYGMGWTPVSGSPTSIDVTFGVSGRVNNGATFGASGATFSGFGSWRATLATPSAPVGFGKASNVNGAGLYTVGAQEGLNTGASIAAGNVGEVISATITSTNSTTTEADITGASIALTPGVWHIFYYLNATFVTGTNVNDGGTLYTTMTNAANTHVVPMEAAMFVRNLAATLQGTNGIGVQTLARSTVIPVASSTTYKLRLRRAENQGTNTASIDNLSGSNSSTFFAVRIV